MLTYILQVSLCWAIFYLLYWLLLSKETFFHFNRWYLLSTFVLSFAIPKVEWQLPQPVAESDIAVVYFQPITVGMETLEVTVTATALTPSIGVMDVLTWIYWLGVAFFVLRFLVGLVQIIRFYHKSERQKRDGYELVLSSRPHAPFSFFNRLFMSKAMELNSEDQQNILRHELAHIRGKHSLDVLLVELSSVLFWCSPFVYLYRRSLRNVHEYIADAAVLKTTKKKQYGHLLIRQSQSGHSIAIANHFHSQLKKRILMMMRNQSKRRAMLKYLLVIPLTLTVMLVFSNADAQASLQEKAENISAQLTTLDWSASVTTEPHEQFSSIKVEDGEIRFSTKEGTTIKPDTLPLNLRAEDSNNGPIHFEIYYPNGYVTKFTPEKNEKNVNFDFVDPKQIESVHVDRNNGENRVKIYMKDPSKSNLDAAPIFAGCENIADPEERKKCSDKEMLMFIYKNIKYPAAAREKGIQGTVYVKYGIDERGYVTGATVQKGIGGGCDEEVLRVLNSMPRWTPARKDGKVIASPHLMLPVNYKLEGSQTKASFLSENELRDTIMTYNLDKQKGEMVVKDWNDRKVTVVGYGEQKATQKVESEKDGAVSEELVVVSYGNEKKAAMDEEIFKIVEEMPLFPGCDELGTYTEKKPCSDRKMLEFIYKNIKYPKAARDNGTEGMVVVSFVVEKDGSISTLKIQRDIGDGCGVEALSVVGLMQEQGIRWTPGKQRGRDVRVQFNLPIRFKLDNQPKQETAPTEAPAKLDLPANTLELKEFKANPNPTNGLLNVYFKGDAEPTTISVIDISGKGIFTTRLTNFNGAYNETIDLSSYNKGLLILQIRQGDRVYSEKIVLQ